MKIGAITNYNQPAFQAVNQKYLKWAEKDYKIVKNVSGHLLESLTDDVILFGDISKKDAIDTMNAIRKYVNRDSMEAFENRLKAIKNS